MKSFNIFDLNIFNIDLCKQLIDNYEELCDEFSCSICSDLVYKKEFYACKEGCSVSCKDCWIKLLENKKECCGFGINSIQDLSRCRYLETSFLNKRIKCPFSLNIESLLNCTLNECGGKRNHELLKDQTRCNEIIKIKDLESHLSQCEYRLVKCTNKVCKETLRSSQLGEHLINCPFTEIICELCNMIVYNQHMKNHLEQVCQNKEIECIHCDNKIVRKSKNQHIQDECLNVIVKCKYLEFGCDRRIKRSKLQDHLNNIDHLYYMNCLIEKQSKELDFCKLENKNLLDKIQFMNNQIVEHSTQLKDTNTKLNEQINNNQNINSKLELLSKQYKVMNYKLERQSKSDNEIQNIFYKEIISKAPFISLVKEYDKWEISSYNPNINYSKTINIPDIQGTIEMHLKHEKFVMVDHLIFLFNKSNSRIGIKVKIRNSNEKLTMKRYSEKTKLVPYMLGLSKDCFTFPDVKRFTKEGGYLSKNNTLTIEYTIFLYEK